jgi:hypothetical protein
MINELNKLGRFFAFGDSLTRCIWPTWADILGKEFAHYENWAMAGSGNQFIFHSLIECHKRNQFTKDDTIIVQWVSTYREDRYIKELGGWIGNGPSIDPAIINMTCNEGQLIRDLSLIFAAQELLEKWQVHYEFLSPVIVTADEQSLVLALYSDVLANCKNNLVDTKITKIETHNHWDIWPVNSISTKRFYWKKFYEYMSGADWPAFEDFITDDYVCSKYVKKELLLFVEKFSNTSQHATPPEHLQFLDNIFPTNNISNATRQWVNGLSREIDPSIEIAYYNSNMPTRFSIRSF